MNDLKCILPWIHIASTPSGRVRPCCLSENFNNKDNALSIYQNDLNEIFQSSEYLQLRSVFNDKQYPKECEVCFLTESRGMTSKRQLENEKWGTSSPIPQIKYLDLRFNSICNLKCVMCSHQESTSWKKDTIAFSSQAKNPSLREYFEKNLNSESEKNLDKFWKNFLTILPNLEEIYFAGGEPLIQKAHDKCLELILINGKNNEINLVYNTNGVNITSETLKIWSKFKNVQVNLSLDAFADKNEFIRFPSKWSQTLEILTLLDSSPENIQIRITTTVQILNVFYLKELITWKINANFKKIQMSLGAGDVDLNILHYPAHLNVQILSSKDKLCIKKILEEILEIEKISNNFKRKINGLIKYIFEKEIEALKGSHAFLEYIAILDRSRPINSSKVFPILKELNFE